MKIKNDICRFVSFFFYNTWAGVTSLSVLFFFYFSFLFNVLHFYSSSCAYISPLNNSACLTVSKIPHFGVLQ